MTKLPVYHKGDLVVWNMSNGETVICSVRHDTDRPFNGWGRLLNPEWISIEDGNGTPHRVKITSVVPYRNSDNEYMA